MKKFFVLFSLCAAAALVSCEKQSEADKKAEIERQVQERLAAERQAQQQQELAQRQADLDAREKALAAKENAPEATPSESLESRTLESRGRSVEPRERAISVGYSTFYNKLDPYGDWIETNDYGYVFRPRQTESSRSWRPYTNGRWVYTDAGWTWISEEPFGWATYHYGRWTRLRGVGWVWVPGNEWAPAWVSWRKGNDYVGWAPLPPEARFDQRTGIRNWSDNYYDVGPDQYCFVASREFGAPRVEQTLLPSERNVTIINQTTNVTNITYKNTTIVNEGPNYDELRSVSREPMQRYRLERNVNINVAAGEPRPEVRGETVVVASPVIGVSSAAERPTIVKQTIGAAAVDLGWAAIANQEEAKTARAKMKAEATPPPNAPSKKFVRAESTTRASAVAQTPESSTPPSRSASATATTSASPAPVATATKPSRPATATATASASATPVATATKPRELPSASPSATPSASATSVLSPATSPTASQRRGRLIVPDRVRSRQPLPSMTPSPQSNSSAIPQGGATAAETPGADKVPSGEMIPPRGSPIMPATSASQGPMKKGQFRSQAERFAPKKIQPMPSESPSPGGESTPAPKSSLTPATTPDEKLTKQERKEQKREERREMKHERKAGNQSPSPSATP